MERSDSGFHLMDLCAYNSFRFLGCSHCALLRMSSNENIKPHKMQTHKDEEDIANETSK